MIPRRTGGTGHIFVMLIAACGISVALGGSAVACGGASQHMDLDKHAPSGCEGKYVPDVALYIAARVSCESHEKIQHCDQNTRDEAVKKAQAYIKDRALSARGRVEHDIEKQGCGEETSPSTTPACTESFRRRDALDQLILRVHAIDIYGLAEHGRSDRSRPGELCVPYVWPAPAMEASMRSYTGAGEGEMMEWLKNVVLGPDYGLRQLINYAPPATFPQQARG